MTRSPEEIGGAEVAMDEGWLRGKGRRIALQGLEGALEGTGLAGKPHAKIPDPWPDILEGRVGKERPSRGDGEGVQGR